MWTSEWERNWKALLRKWNVIYLLCDGGKCLFLWRMATIQLVLNVLRQMGKCQVAAPACREAADELTGALLARAAKLWAQPRGLQWVQPNCAGSAPGRRPGFPLTAAAGRPPLPVCPAVKAVSDCSVLGSDGLPRSDGVDHIMWKWLEKPLCKLEPEI